MTSPPPDGPDGRSSTAAEGTDLIGRVLGERYRIDALVARGGMARVFRARDLRLDRDVALKILSNPYAESADFTRRFLGEARTAASLSHPNLVHVYDSGASDGLHYMVMELLVGYRSLQAGIAERGTLPAAEAVGVAREVLAGLDVVHEHGLVHADVKAANVMVGPGPSKLIDFGIARGPRVVTDDGTSLGSLHAMSPEQLRGDDLGPESDLFAVGVVLYQALTGAVPYPGDDPNEVAKRQAAGAPPPPSSIAMRVSDRLDQVVLQALNPERALRFNTAPAMSHALEIALADAVDLPPVVRRDETTRVVRVRRKPARLRAWRGQPGGQGSGRPGRRAAPWLALAVLAAIVVTVAFVVNAGDALPSVPGSRASASQTPSAAATPSLAPGKVRVPDTIGMSEQQAEAAARASGLRWEIRWQEAAGQTPGIYDQEPEAGSVVDRGSRFTMYAYRQPD